VYGEIAQVEFARGRFRFDPGVATPMSGFLRSASENHRLIIARAGARLGPRSTVAAGDRSRHDL